MDAFVVEHANLAKPMDAACEGFIALMRDCPDPASQIPLAIQGVYMHRAVNHRADLAPAVWKRLSDLACVSHMDESAIRAWFHEHC